MLKKNIIMSIQTKINISRNIHPKINKFKSQLFFQSMAFMGMLFLLIFCYFPMFGLVMAFQDFNPGLGFVHSEFVGFFNFMELFSDPKFLLALRNTVLLSTTKFAFCFICPILFALALNEVRNNRYKKLIQTASYLPHFISWVVLASMISLILSTDQTGLLNALLVKLKIIDDKVSYLSYPNYYFIMAVVSEIWKSTGFSAIIYIAAISGIDEQIIEAARVDGANRFQRITKIILPSISNTILYLFILGVGNIFGGGLGGSNFNQGFLLGNGLNQSISDVVETYTLRHGLQLGKFSYAAAAGLFLSIICLIMFLSANGLSRILKDDSII